MPLTTIIVMTVQKKPSLNRELFNGKRVKDLWFLPISMLSFKRLFDISRDAVLANDSRISASCWSLERRVLSLRSVLLIAIRWFLPFPYWREVSLTLRALEGLWRWRYRRLLGNKIDHVLQTDQIDELWIGRAWHEVHLRRWRFGRWYLQQRLFQLFPERLLRCRLALRRRLTVFPRSIL